MRSAAFLLLAASAALTTACSESASPDAGAPLDFGSDVDGGQVPCDVQQVFATHCLLCHGQPFVAPAKTSLVTYDDLMAPSSTDALTNEVQMSILRMRDTMKPMPPASAPTVPDAEIAVLENWMAAGAPTAVCDAPPANPWDQAPQCTTGVHWLFGTHGSISMTPGQACVTCHSTTGAPYLSFGGTVYKTRHEPDDCNGVPGTTSDPIEIVVTDYNGQVITTTANSAGNFFSQTPFVPPITTLVRYQGRELAMATPSNTGDCNGCHTQDGAHDAPGRILLP